MYVVLSLDWTLALVAGLGLSLAVVAFLRTEVALFLLIASMLFSPEFIVTGTTEGSDFGGRGVTLRGDDFLIVVIGLTWFVKTSIYKELNLIGASLLNPAIGFYAVTCLLSTLIGVVSGNVQLVGGMLFVLKYIEYFVLYYLVINNLKDLRQANSLLAVAVVTALIVSLVASFQIPAGGRVTAPFEGEHGEPNTLGGYLLMMMMMCLAIALFAPRRRIKILFLACAGVMLLPFIYSLSRSSYLGLIPALIVLLWLSRNRALALVLICSIWVVLLFPSLIPKPVADRIAFTFTQPVQGAQVSVLGRRLDTSTSARLASFEMAFEAFQDRPVLGWGITGWRFIDSMYVRTFVELGLVGALAFLFLIVSCYRVGWAAFRYFKDHGLYRGIAAGYLAALTGFLFHAIGSNTFIIVRIMEPFWLLTGILAVLPTIGASAGILPYQEGE